MEKFIPPGAILTNFEVSPSFGVDLEKNHGEKKNAGSPEPQAFF